MSMDTFFQALQDTGVATAIREGESLFPWIECVHVLALTLVIGSIAVVDLRLVGWASRDRGVTEMTRSVLPVTWTAFVFAVASGGLLFASNATTYAHNIYFQIKVALLVLAGINMATFHLFTGREAAAWHTPATTPAGARIAGFVSLCLWIAIAACGRWIGFTINTPT